MHTVVRYVGVRNRPQRQHPSTRFRPVGREGASRAEAAVRASEAHHFNVVFQAWRKVRLYEQQGDLELAQAQRIVLRERARWVAKQREEARGWRLQVE